VRWPKSTKQVWNLSRFRDLREKLREIIRWNSLVVNLSRYVLLVGHIEI
jgi:hypothetical protein